MEGGSEGREKNGRKIDMTCCLMLCCRACCRYLLVVHLDKTSLSKSVNVGYGNIHQCLGYLKREKRCIIKKNIMVPEEVH